MTRLSISLFGPLVVRLDGHVLAGFSYDKVRALLAYLVVESSRPRRREHLAALLWPDLSAAKGFSNLRTALYDLRTILHDRHAHPPFLSITHTTLQLNPEGSIWSDIAAFRAATSALDGHTSGGKGDPAYETALNTAAELYNGDFLQGFGIDSASFEDWLLVQREALHLRILDVLERLVVLYRERGDHDRVLACARRQVMLEPWREQSHRSVMRALTALGQRAAAIAQYETCRRVLQDKLGIEPEAETLALLARIRAGTLNSEGGAAPRLLLDGLNAASPGLGAVAFFAPRGPGVLDGANVEGGAVPGLVTPLVWTPYLVGHTVQRAEALRRRAGAGGEDAVMAAAQAALDVASAAGGAGAEALGYLYAGVVLANSTGVGFQASLSHFGRALALAQAEHMSDVAFQILHYLGIEPPENGEDKEYSALTQVLALYRKLGRRVDESRALHVLALANLQAGDLDAALRRAEEGGAIAREAAARREQGALCHVMGQVALLRGQYGDAMRCLQTALSCFHEVGAPAGEAAALRTLGALFDGLGAYHRARQVLARAFDILPQGGSPAAVLEGWGHQALLSLHTGDDAGAAASAGKMLSLLAALGDGSQRSGYPRLRFLALAVRARVLAHQGRHGAAAVAYRDALAVRQWGRWPGVRAELRAGLAELALLAEEPARALAEIESVLPHLKAEDTTGALDPLRIYLVCYRVLEACGNPDAWTVLAHARQVLSMRAATIEDQGLRRTYLEQVEVNREIAAAAARLKTAE